MRKIVVQLPHELQKWIGKTPVAKIAPLPVGSYRELMVHVARLAYLNKDYLLFFRGQGLDYVNKAGASSFYPSIYRGERLSRDELQLRFDLLYGASSRLSEALRREKVEGYGNVAKRRLIQWAILQHYGVCATPLLDFTQSVRVACSFALLDDAIDEPYVFVFGLPYLTNRISINSEHDLVNIRLLGICPPSALRPHFQEGYLAGTDDVTTEYMSKNQLDFNNRLIAKFRISRSQDFWKDNFMPIPEASLYPCDDEIDRICREIRLEVGTGLESAELVDFLQAWSNLESSLLSLARSSADRIFSSREAIHALTASNILDPTLERRLLDLRAVRNDAIHKPAKLTAGRLVSAMAETSAIQRQFQGLKK